ncbi:11195_t:CDS:2 [Dentiscutata heterogama]|uniref:11195_t:CDS:1 n=1 Tax=Dentiscutata heterogama TaxID=1316150 RepID=A0ACA9JXP7_9GLOM|nr:11195_t:CDS:2 [Dentiscutata heterogama]
MSVKFQNWDSLTGITTLLKLFATILYFTDMSQQGGQQNIAAQTNPSLENLTPDEQSKHLTEGNNDPFPREQPAINEENPQLPTIICGIPFN